MTKAKRKHKADEENKQSSEEKKAPISKGGKKGAKKKRSTSSARTKNETIESVAESTTPSKRTLVYCFSIY